ncbi:MAG: hypothetical protein JJT75_09955 [Opitutales bacterium]|nr:hypothetical protein [Opitutales bacterium]MCH8540687.1 hypothetical protein [Opitutales bacterium]
MKSTIAKAIQAANARTSTITIGTETGAFSSPLGAVFGVVASLRVAGLGLGLGLARETGFFKVVFLAGTGRGLACPDVFSGVGGEVSGEEVALAGEGCSGFGFSLASGLPSVGLLPKVNPCFFGVRLGLGLFSGVGEF